MKYTKEFIKSITPETSGFTEKYSKNLSKYIAGGLRVFRGKYSLSSGQETEDYEYYVGILDGGNVFFGNHINIAIKDPNIYSKRSPQIVKYLEDITEEFVLEYQRIGKCAIPGFGYHPKYEEVSSTVRKCSYCGAVEEHREVVRKEWVAVENNKKEQL